MSSVARIETHFFDPIRVWNRDLEDSGYLWIDLFETKLSGGVLGSGKTIENSNLLATFENVEKSDSSVKMSGP